MKSGETILRMFFESRQTCRKPPKPNRIIKEKSENEICIFRPEIRKMHGSGEPRRAGPPMKELKTHDASKSIFFIYALLFTTRMSELQ